MKAPQYAWLNGEFVRWQDATVHIRTESFMRGANVFEGIRAYAGDDGQLYIFRGKEHLDRLFHSSMKIMRLAIDWTPEEMLSATVELLRKNDFHEDVHIRPTAFFDAGDDFGFAVYNPQGSTGAAITAVERGQRSSDSRTKGISVGVSSWRRIDDVVMPPRVKAGANYLNSRYVLMEAKANGFDSAIVLNAAGKVAEAASACIFIVRSGRVFTPPVTASILESITRATLLQLFRDKFNIDVVERDLDRTELYIADEVFMCGTGQEVQPIVEVDRYPVGTGSPGPITSAMQEAYFGIVTGRDEAYQSWLTPVYG